MFPFPKLFPPVVERDDVPIVTFPLYTISPPFAYKATFPSPPFILIFPFETVNLPSVVKIPILFLANFSIVISGAWILALVVLCVYITPTALSTISVVLSATVLSFPLLIIFFTTPVSISVQSTPVVSFLPFPICTLAIACASEFKFEISPAI